MDEPSAETKYGAFRAIWTLDKNDPSIRGKKLNEHFLMHVVDSKGDPMIHLTRHRRPEVVLFGANQRFRTPLALKAGNHINVNSQTSADSITLTRFQVGQPDQRKIVSTKVVDVIEAAAEMGATYPDIAQMLTIASNDYNLEGRLELDALPQAGRLYYRTVSGSEGGKETKKAAKVGRPSSNPNLFPVLNPLGEAPEDSDEVEVPVEGPESGSSTDAGAASLTDISKESKSPSESTPNKDGSSKDDSSKPPAQSADTRQGVDFDFATQPKPKSWFGRFGRSKSKESDEEPPPAKTAEVEKEKKPESDVGGKRDRSKKESTEEAEQLPPVEGSSSKFEIE